MTHYALVGDVGGTNIRLALCDMATGALARMAVYSVRQFATLEETARDYLGAQPQPVQDACIAIACPVTGDRVTMTNHSWTFSIAEMTARLGLRHLEVINDFTAVSMAVPALARSQRIQLGGGEAAADKPIAVYGAGTGLGVAYLVRAGQRWISMPCEGGHVDFAPNSEEEDRVLAVLRREWGHVSAERLLSGQGLVNIYRALALSGGRAPQTLALFCVIMGRVGGNLTLGAFGGVYIAGGIVPRFLDFFLASGFRAGFEDKGRFSEYLAAIPAYLITHEQPGLLGAGAYLRQHLGAVL